nr:hypothetical protein [Bifidobacterium pseudolongum]
MAVEQRAAQFMPFAALAGYEDLLQETAKVRQRQVELGEDAQEALNARLAAVLAHLGEHPRVDMTFFRMDGEGGSGEYLRIEGGVVAKYLAEANALEMTDGRVVPVVDIVRIELNEV